MSISDTIEQPTEEPFTSIHQQIESDEKTNLDTTIFEHPSLKYENPEVLDQPNHWESIFDPQTTFKQNSQGTLEYTFVPPSQRAIQPQLTATIPTILPTPSLKSLSDHTEPISADGSRFDILRNVLSVDAHQEQVEKRSFRSFLLEKKETLKAQNWSHQRLFWVGFACPLIWIYASFRKRKTMEPLWRKRCRFAAFYFIVMVALIILLVTIKTTRVRTGGILVNQ